MTQHVLISKLKYFKILATCFSYNEQSSGQKQNKVLVHSVIVHFMGSHIFYIFNFIVGHM
jgi:hypothetical protein